MALVEDDPGFWTSQCPVRQYGLSHVHDAKCTDGHGASQCCECGRYREPAARSLPPPPPPPAATPMLPEPNPMTGCQVNHSSFSTALLIGEGLEWRRCPSCSVMVEGALRTGVVVGPVYGPGRGDLSVHQRKRLTGRAGWADFNGGR